MNPVDGLTGVNEAMVSMKRVDTKLKTGMSKNVLALAEQVAIEAGIRCPIDLGNMLSSIEYRKVDDQTAEVTVGGGFWGGVDVDYPAFVEFGTRKMDAQPFVRPAVDYVVKTYGFAGYLQLDVNRAIK
jgi:HK97 gp10 family phage protein